MGFVRGIYSPTFAVKPPATEAWYYIRPLFSSTSAEFVTDRLMPPSVSPKESITLSRNVDECAQPEPNLSLTDSRHPVYPTKSVTVSRNVDECKPLDGGA